MTSAKVTESQVQKAVCDYIRLQYPNILFISDTSGLKTSIGVAKQLKSLRSCRGIPDLIILQPNAIYHGLCIEIKRSKDEVFTKSGELRNSMHIKEQFGILAHLSSLGYFCSFGCGLDDCIRIIDKYMLTSQF
jgi:hypothetical protein